MNREGGTAELQIGICDDDSRMLSVYENAVRESLERCGCAGRLMSYQNSENLLWDVTEDGFHFDLLLALVFSFRPLDK